MARTTITDYRKHLQKRYGFNLETVWDVIDDVLHGRPWIPVLSDGREAIPVVPTVQDRMSAAKTILAYGLGNPVSTVDVQGQIEHTHVNVALDRARPEVLLRIVNGDESALAELDDSQPRPQLVEGTLVKDDPTPSPEPHRRDLEGWFEADSE